MYFNVSIGGFLGSYLIFGNLDSLIFVCYFFCLWYTLLLTHINTEIKQTLTEIKYTHIVIFPFYIDLY